MTQPSPIDIRNKLAHALRSNYFTREETALLIKCLECAPVLAEGCQRFAAGMDEEGVSVDCLRDNWRESVAPALAAWREGAVG